MESEFLFSVGICWNGTSKTEADSSSAIVVIVSACLCCWGGVACSGCPIDLQYVKYILSTRLDVGGRKTQVMLRFLKERDIAASIAPWETESSKGLCVFQTDACRSFPRTPSVTFPPAVRRPANIPSQHRPTRKINDIRVRWWDHETCKENKNKQTKGHWAVRQPDRQPTEKRKQEKLKSSKHRNDNLHLAACHYCLQIHAGARFTKQFIETISTGP